MRADKQTNRRYADRQTQLDDTNTDTLFAILCISVGSDVKIRRRLLYCVT